MTVRVYYDNIQLVIDFDKIEGFDWDKGNARKNEKHGVTQAEAEQVFVNEHLLLTPDKEHSTHEQRFRACGQTSSGRLLTVIFTLRAKGTIIRIISARDMHLKERRVYEEKAKTDT